jgi:peptidoglycan/LPS O-acetylase OafA/YrhL
MKNNRPYLTTLTPLRGIAALLVVIFHSNLMLSTFIEPFGANFIASGWLWVDFFFVLSGFILCYVYGSNFSTGVTPASYWKYMKARFARIYPLHFITLVWCFGCAIIIRYYASGLAPFFDQMFSLPSAVPSLLLMQSLGLYSSAPLNTPSWSLSTEWWMYMIFPFFIPLLLRLKTIGKAISIITIAILFIVVKYYLSPINAAGPPTLNVITDFGFFRCMAGFFLGMFTFKIYEEAMGAGIFSYDFTFIIFFAAVIVAMTVGADDLFIVALFPFIILAAAYNSTLVKRLLDLPVLQRLGDWSFSIYMVHVPIMYVFWIVDIKNNPGLFAVFPPATSIDIKAGVMYCMAMVVLSLLVAAFTYNFVEVPSRKFLNAKFKSSNTP